MIFRFLKNCWYYRKALSKSDDDWSNVNLLLLLKLEKVYKYWGENTNYEKDYDDKFKLLDIISDLKYIQSHTFQLTEKENKEHLVKAYGKLGRLLPKLWD